MYLNFSSCQFQAITEYVLKFAAKVSNVAEV